MQAEAAVETKNSIVEVGNSMLNANVLALTPRGLFSSGPSRRVHPLSSARSVQSAAKRTIPITPTGVELPTLKPDATELEPAAAQSSRSEFCIKHLMQNISFIL